MRAFLFSLLALSPAPMAARSRLSPRNSKASVGIPKARLGNSAQQAPRIGRRQVMEPRFDMPLQCGNEALPLDGRMIG